MFKISQLKLQLVLASVITICGIILLFYGAVVPPPGVIDTSILVAYGESLTFVGALLGIDYSYRFKEKMHRNEN